VSDICCHFLDIAVSDGKSGSASVSGALSLFVLIDEGQHAAAAAAGAGGGGGGSSGSGNKMELMSNPLLPSSRCSDVPLSCQPLKRDAYLGTVHLKTLRANAGYSLIFKRKLFVPSSAVEREFVENASLAQLLYLQTSDDVFNGSIPCSEASGGEAQMLANAAAGIAVDQGAALADVADAAALRESALALEYVPVAWQARHTPDEWGGALFEAVGAAAPCACDGSSIAEVVDAEAEQLRQELVRWAQSCPQWGMCTFHVRVNRDKRAPSAARAGGGAGGAGVGSTPLMPQLELAGGAMELELLLLGINAMGVHIVHPGTRDVLRVFSFADIYRWGGTASLFSLVVWDTTRDTEVELQLWTREGPTIAGLVVEYINTIMEDRATPALPKRSLGTSASD